MLNKLFKYLKSLLSVKKTCAIAEGSDIDPIAASQVRIKYYLNDPAFPELTGYTDASSPYKLQINVMNFTGRPYGFDTPAGKAANTFAVLQKGINFTNRKLNLEKWAVVKKLNVNPLAGVQANAYYDRQNLKFFYFKRENKEIFTCLSADIISHELGHALLDAIRPEFFNMASLEIWAFHESFGDINAICCTLSHDEIIDILINQTGGDLMKPNLVEGVAEQFGLGLGLQGALRKAINTFKYTKPELLPKNAPHDQLSGEPHSFSRVFTAAFYEILCEAVKVLGGASRQNVKQAVDIVFGTFLEACRSCPAAANIYSVVATNWISIVDKNYKNIAQKMKDVFKNKNILGTVSMLSTGKNYEFGKKLVTSYGIGMNRIEKYECQISVSDLFKDEVVQQSVTMEEIMALKINIPADEYLEAQGMSSANICASMDEACESAKHFISYLVESNLYGEQDNQSWFNEDKTLTRKFIACDCYMNNCTNPQSPEYGKCWKPENNTGCCTYGSCKNKDEITPTKVERSCNTRYNSSCGAVRYNGKC